jgi:hypothetical protein
MENQMTKPRSARARLVDLWRTLREYLGTVGQGRTQGIVDRESLRQFLESRASHVAQISLYGYLRTRAGARYPELFANEDFLKSINIAKWYIWLACLSDLSIFAGGLITQRTGSGRDVVGPLMMGKHRLRYIALRHVSPAAREHGADCRQRIVVLNQFHPRRLGQCGTREVIGGGPQPTRAND